MGDDDPVAAYMAAWLVWRSESADTPGSRRRRDEAQAEIYRRYDEMTWPQVDEQCARERALDRWSDRNREAARA